MAYELQLAFLRELLKDMNISSCVLEHPERHIPPGIDLHLRADLFGLENYSGFLQNSMSQARENTVYRFFDEYDCNYIFLRLPGEETYFFIGPYLLALPTGEHLSRKAAGLKLTPGQTDRMRLYYTALPMIEDENLLLSMANTFANHLWGSAGQYAMEYVDYAIPDRYEPIPCAAAPERMPERQAELSTLERSYACENQLMDAVSRGKLHLVTAAASAMYRNSAGSGGNDSLRDRKNHLVILKTLLRKAAEYGGVHPIHLHRLSSHYAVLIENTRSVRQSIQLQEEMIRSFCQLVRRHSLSRYSGYVGQAITLVQYDLTADLSLHTIARKLNVNSSYLSSLFHREYGCTLTEFVNRERIDHSILLLQMTSRSIQDIAAESGIQDVNYFIKLFKKQTGFTPRQFRKANGK